MKTLRRSRTQRVLFGVCGGFAEYFGLDADVVRILWIVSILLGGVGILPYVAAVVLMPEGREEPGAAPREGGAARWIGLALVAVSFALFLRLLAVPGLGLGALTVWTWKLFPPVLLFAVGALLLWPSLRGLVTGVRDGLPVQRSVTDRVLAGVAGGIGQATGTDANLVRIAFVLAAALSSGFAVLLYLALILLLREEEVPMPSGPVPGPPPPPPVSPSGEPPAVDQGPAESGR